MPFAFNYGITGVGLYARQATDIVPCVYTVGPTGKAKYNCAGSPRAACGDVALGSFLILPAGGSVCHKTAIVNSMCRFQNTLVQP